MNSRKKQLPPSVLAERGTFRPHRHGDTMEIVQFDDLPQAPDWLTKSGKQAWLDNIGRISTVTFATEADSDLFGLYCNMSGAAADAWRAGAVPPTTHVTEIRRLSELFGIAGRKSRVGQKSDGKPAGNPFIKLKG